MFITNGARRISNILNKNGYSTFIVGGCVRDSLIGTKPKDWDICTDCTPEEMLEVFKEFKVIPTGIKYGTITVEVHGMLYEVTTFRTDGEYSDSRRPEEVKYVKSIQEDLSRRDLTINAIAVDLKTYDIIDPFNGREDIHRRIIRTVGNPNDRFNEDALRMLRAVRFASRLGFKIYPQTFAAIKNNRQLLRNVSVERIQKELEGILLSKSPALGVELLYETGLMEVIIPEIQKEFMDKEKRKKILVALRNTKQDLNIRYLALMHTLGSKTVREIFVRLKLGTKLRDKVVTLVKDFNVNIEQDNIVEIRRIARKVGIDNTKHILSVRKTIASEQEKYFIEKFEEVLEGECILDFKSLEISGKDLIELGVPQGREIRFILEEMLKIVMEYPEMNKREILVEKAKEQLKGQ